MITQPKDTKMNSLTSKIVKTIAFFALALTVPAIMAHQIQAENEAATADIQAITNRELARQGRFDEIK
jgi:hypothetical protein